MFRKVEVGEVWGISLRWGCLVGRGFAGVLCFRVPFGEMGALSQQISLRLGK